MSVRMSVNDASMRDGQHSTTLQGRTVQHKCTGQSSSIVGCLQRAWRSAVDVSTLSAAHTHVKVLEIHTSQC